MDFDFSYRLRKWTKEEKGQVILLREQGLSPAKIVKETGIPLNQVRFWIYGSRGSKRSKRSKNGALNSNRQYYRMKHNDWLSWKSNTLSSSFRKRYENEIKSGICDPIPVQDIKEWIVDVTKHCHYCEEELTEKTFGVDHAMPVSRGGQNNISNLRQCCKNCNLVKGALTEEEYIQLRQVCSAWDDKGKSLFARLKRGNKFYK